MGGRHSLQVAMTRKPRLDVNIFRILVHPAKRAGDFGLSSWLDQS
jgi:hypothetical protein